MRKNQSLNIGISNLIFIVLSGFVLLFYFGAFGGLILSDDFTYCYNAFHLFSGSFELNNDIFTHRFGVFVPTGILYLLFGVNDITTTVWPLFCFLATGLLIFFNFKKRDTTAAVYALVISSLSFYPLFFSNKLFPDVIVSFFGIASGFALYNFRGGKVNSFAGPILFSLTFFIGFLTKETMLYLIPFYGIIFLSDIFKKQNGFFWKTSIGVSFLLFVTYFGAYQIYTDDFLYRFKVIQGGHYAFSYSYFDKSIGHLLKRLSYEPVLMFIASEVFIPFALALPVLFNLKLRDFLNPDSKEKFWSIFSLVLLIMFWFGSTSYKFYNPLSLNPRMYIMLVPVLSVVAGISISKANYNNLINGFYTFVFFLTTIFTYQTESVRLAFIYGLLFLFFTCLYLYRRFRSDNLNVSLPVFVFMGILLIHPVYSMIKTDRKNFEDEKEMVRTDLNGTNGINVVITDPLLRVGSIYFNQFVPNKHYLFMNYKQAGKIKKNRVDKYFILINPKNLQELIDCSIFVPDYYLNPPKHWNLVKKRGEVLLLEIPDINEISAPQ